MYITVAGMMHKDVQWPRKYQHASEQFARWRHQRTISPFEKGETREIFIFGAVQIPLTPLLQRGEQYADRIKALLNKVDRNSEQLFSALKQLTVCVCRRFNITLAEHPMNRRDHIGTGFD